MTTRRQVLEGLFGALAATACEACAASQGAHEAATPATTAAPEPLALEPIVDLVPAAGLEWLIEVRPREILADASLASLLAALATEEQIETFARRHGGVDLRRADQVAVAGHGASRTVASPNGSILGLVRTPVEPARIEAAFAERAVAVEGRAMERGVTRFWGTVGTEREQVAVFGHDGVGIERGTLGPLQAAVYFAQGRLKRSLPALRAEPLAAAAERLGVGPVRGFAPGPFEGEWASGFGGLLGASTAVAVRLDAGPPGSASERRVLLLRLVLTGAWGADAPAAAQRLLAALRVLGEDPLGRLTGLDRPVGEPVTTVTPGALALDVALDPVRMTEGVRAAMSAPVAEIMAF